MMHRTAPLLLALSALALGGSACDLETLPTTSNYASRNAARASVTMAADTPLSRDDVRDVEIIIDTLALHRPIDDRWVLLSGDEARVSLLSTPRSNTFEDVPVHVQTYDRIAFGVGEVRVATDDGWHTATVTDEEIELDGDYTVEGNVAVQLAFDVRAGLSGDASNGFVFEPLVAAEVRSEG